MSVHLQGQGRLLERILHLGPTEMVLDAYLECISQFNYSINIWLFASNCIAGICVINEHELCTPQTLTCMEYYKNS